MSDELGVYPDWPIMRNGWDVQRVFEYLTQESRLSPAEAINQLNLLGPTLFYIIYIRGGQGPVPERKPGWQFGVIVFRLKNRKVETLLRGVPATEQDLVLRARPDDVRRLGPELASNTRKGRPTLKTFAEYQRDWKRDHGYFPGRDQDVLWAESKNYSVEYVRDTLRAAFKNTLSPKEQAEFGKTGPKRRISRNS